MIRVLAGLAAWLGGTALAVSLAWLGAGLVVHAATASPSLPPAATVPPSPLAAAAPTISVSIAPPADVSAPASRKPRPSPAPRPPQSRTPTPAPTPSGTVRSYALDGGQVTLTLTATSASLVTAVPEAGFAVQTWSGTDWLRVDFSSGNQVSSLIAAWNGTPPSVTITN